MKRALSGVIAVSSIALASGLLTGCDKKQAATSAEGATPPPSETKAQVADVRQVEPPRPDHEYALEDDGEYGYRRALSEDDVKAGRATAALLMVRYVGEKNGVRSVKLVDGNNVGVISCSPPCEFVKARTYFAGQLVKTETLPVTDGSLIQAVMADAISGKLHVFGKQSKAPSP